MGSAFHTNLIQSMKGFNKSFWVVNTLELFERGAYYGMMAVLARHLQFNLGFSAPIIGALISFLIVLLYFVPIVAAALAEKYGYRETLLVAFVLMGVGYFTAYFMETPAGFVLIIFIMGIGAGAFKPMVSATVAHVTSVEQRNLGYSIYYWMINLGAFMVPLILSFFLEESTYRWAFVLAGSVMVANLVVTLLYFDSPVVADRQKSIQKVLGNAAVVLGDRRFVLLLAVYSGFWFMFAMNQSFLPLYMKNFALMPEWFQTTHLAIINPGTIILLGPFLGKRVEKHDSLKMMVVGISIFVAGFALLGLVQVSLLFVVAIIIFSIGEFITHPNFISYTSKIAPKEKVAIYMGYVFIPIGVGQTLGSLTGGFLYQLFAVNMHQPQIFWAFYACVGLLTIAGLILYHRRFGVELREAALAKAEPSDRAQWQPPPYAADSLASRLWKPGALVVAALALMPLLLGAALASGELDYYKDLDERKGLYAYRVEYLKQTESTTESHHVDDGETYTFEFEGLVYNLTTVTVELRYSESEEALGAGGVCDDVSATVTVPEEYEADNSTTSGSQTDCNEDPDIVLTVRFDNDFAWEGEQIKAHSPEELWEALRLDRARGVWQVEVTVQVNGDSLITDSGEDIEVTFIREAYEVVSVERV